MIVTKDRREIELMAEAGRIVALVHESLKKLLSQELRQNKLMRFAKK
mgnify:CR=1 FL=1